MKASKKNQIDIHLKQAIAYILNPEKLGETNLAGGINCPLGTAYEQMKATKEMFQKTGGRQGYHFILSLPPGEGTPEQMYDIGIKFAERFLKGEYEAIVAVHTDRDHLHAHIVINSVNMVTGHKFQYIKGDWKYILQPITNELCEKYGFEIMPEEYSKDPKNMSRPEWEREQSFSKLIKEDVQYCAMLAEDEGHFFYLLKRLGYEVKDGAHIALKAPGMKRFKRIDTISEEYSRENLINLIKYTDKSMAMPKVHTLNPTYVKRAKLSPYQKKYYAKLYRLRLIEKKRFDYKSASYYQAIRKMHELQEEYLLVTDYNIQSLEDLMELKTRLQNVERKILSRQQELYKERGSQKRSCNTPEDFEVFRKSENDYRSQLEEIKEQKNTIKGKLKITDRCLKNVDSEILQKLAQEIPLDDMQDIGDMYDVKVPENPDKKVVVIEQGQPISDNSYKEEAISKAIVEVVDRPSLPNNKHEYQKLTFDEKAKLSPFNKMDSDKMFTFFSEYLISIGLNLSFSELYEEYDSVMKCYENQQEVRIIESEVDEAIRLMSEIGMEVDKYDSYDVSMKAMIFHFEDMEYFAGVKCIVECWRKLALRRI